MRSMTGFGAGEAILPGGALHPDGAPGRTTKVSVEIRSVNHRYLDLRVRAPEQLPQLAGVIESLARERLTRGRFDLTVRIEGPIGAMTLDRERARSLFTALKELRDELAPDEPVPLGLLGSAPDLFVPASPVEGALDAALEEAFAQAKSALDEMRDREGSILAEDFRRRLALLGALTTSIGERAPSVVEAYRKRLAERVDRIRGSASVDPTRLEHEVVLFADRADITEELIRLASHSALFEEALRAPGPAAMGRRLDFLLQEMAREVNTIGSKCQDVLIAHAVVELKTEIERMREQVQNVE